MCSTQAYNNSRNLRLRCGCQFPWCALALNHVPRYLTWCLSCQTIFFLTSCFFVWFLCWCVLINWCQNSMRLWPNCKQIFRHLLVGTEENYENPQSGWLLSWLRFETSTVRIVPASTNLLGSGLVVKTLNPRRPSRGQEVCWLSYLMFMIIPLRVFILLTSVELKTVPRYGFHTKHFLFLLDYSFLMWLFRYSSLYICTI
jgi:hypothetical protein